MPVFSKLFGSSKAHKAEKYFNELLLKIEKKHKPMAEVGWAIGRASNNCCDAFRGRIQAATEKERQWREMSMFWEFICFYMYMTIRHAESRLTESQMGKLQNFLSASVSGATVNSYCAHLPDDIRGKIVSELSKVLNERKLEYRELENREYTQFDSSKQSQTADAISAALITVFMRLGLNVSPHITNAEKNKATIKTIAGVAIAEWNKMGLDKLIAEVRRVI